MPYKARREFIVVGCRVERRTACFSAAFTGSVSNAAAARTSEYGLQSLSKQVEIQILCAGDRIIACATDVNRSFFLHGVVNFGNFVPSHVRRWTFFIRVAIFELE